MGKLNALSIQRATEPGLYSDSNGLYLQISRSGAKSWIFRFMMNKRARAMGLGPIQLVSLAEARMKALECRKLLLNGIDPIDKRTSERQQLALEAAKAITFDQCATAYIEAHKASWKNEKHLQQWRNTLETYASPKIGKLSIQDVDTTLVVKVLEEIWYKKAETANRLRNRIELVLAWATVRGYRKGDNPARWTNHLDQLLPKRSDVQKVKHFAALPFADMGDFMAKLRALDGIAPIALEFCILTATRSSEVFGARWSEINFDESVWTIPAERMKAERPHRIPLSSRAVDILKTVKDRSRGEFVFSGRTPGTALCNNAFLAVLKRRMNLSITAHGFRSSFSDWANEKTGHSRETIEAALAHTIGDQTEAAYRRMDQMLKRRVLMNDWLKHCNSGPKKSGEVVDLNTRQA